MSEEDTPKIPGYELDKPIGTGGQASVYLATQLSMSRPVAIKVIPPGTDAQATELGRFPREAKVLAWMRHDNIVQAIDFGEAGDVRYLVMEFVEGETVLELIKERGALGVKASCGIALQMARALDHAAQFEVLHRDIKPANIIITKKHRAVLVDFGLARPEQSDLQVTMAGVSVGTPHYMPPEQIRGVDTLDLRVDIYALGGTFFHMLTGRVPFAKHDKTQILISHLKDPVRLPDDMKDEIPDHVFAIVVKAMEKDPGKRYQKPAGMISDLEGSLSRLKVGGGRRPSVRRKAAASRAVDPAHQKRLEKTIEERDRLAKERQALIKRAEEIRKKAQEIIHRKNRELEEARAEILSLQGKIEDASELEEDVEERRQLAQRLREVEAERGTLTERLAGAERFLREYEKKAEAREVSATRQIEVLAKERDTLREAVEERDRRLQEARTGTLGIESERDTLKRECERLGQRLLEMEAKAETDLAGTESEVSEKLESLAAEAKSLRAEKEELAARLEAATSEAQEAKEMTVSLARKQGKIDRNSDTLRREIEEMSAKLEDLEAKRSTERRDLAERIKQAEALIAEHDELPVAEVEDLEPDDDLVEVHEVADLDEITGEMERQLEEAKEQAAREQKKLTVERDQARAEVEEGKAEARDLREAEAQTTRALQETEAKLADAREKVRRAEERARQAEAAVREAAEKAAPPRSGAEDLERRLAEEQRRADGIQAELQTVRAKILAMNEKADRVEGEWKDEVAQLTRDREDLQGRVREFEADRQEEEEEAASLAEEESGLKIPKNAREPARNAPMAFVPRGTFLSGEDEGADVDTPQQPVELGSFWIDVYPVTNRQYDEFVKETGQPPPAHWKGDSPPKSTLEHPVVMVTWSDAREFAMWCGKRLPMLLEWQKAARGTDGRIFPWGDEWETDRLNCKESGLGGTTPVGIYRAGTSPFSIRDAAGNVAEWVEGQFNVTGHGKSRQVIRAVCSGSWRDPLARSRCAARRGYPDGGKAPYVGFRCARDG